MTCCGGSMRSVQAVQGRSGRRGSVRHDAAGRHGCERRRRRPALSGARPQGSLLQGTLGRMDNHSRLWIYNTRIAAGGSGLASWQYDGVPRCQEWGSGTRHCRTQRPQAAHLAIHRALAIALHKVLVDQALGAALVPVGQDWRGERAGSVCQAQHSTCRCHQRGVVKAGMRCPRPVLRRGLTSLRSSQQTACDSPFVCLQHRAVALRAYQSCRSPRAQRPESLAARCSAAACAGCTPKSGRGAGVRGCGWVAGRVGGRARGRGHQQRGGCRTTWPSGCESGFCHRCHHRSRCAALKHDSSVV